MHCLGFLFLKELRHVMKQTLTSMRSSIIKIININYNDNYNAHLQINTIKKYGRNCSI